MDLLDSIVSFSLFCFIFGQYAGAVEEYRQVLRLVEEHKGQVRTDDLQLLHTIHNLQEMLSLEPQGIGNTLRDSQLKEQVTVYLSR